MNQPDHLILTVDYEIFGNASGSPLKCVVEPAERILSIAKHFAAPVTLFVEALEFMAMEDEPATKAEGNTVRAQIQDAVKDGHDAQLHLHPQWTRAVLDDQNAWALDMTKWRTGDLEPGEIHRLLASGKQWLETLVKPVESTYTCYAFRAGGWCIQPSARVLQALGSLGFRIESTVAPGLMNAAHGDWYDFRLAPHKPCWRVADDVCVESNSLIWEIPITVGQVSQAIHLISLLRKRWRQDSGLAPGCIGSYVGPNRKAQSLLGKLSKLKSLGYFMLDICTMPATMLIKTVRYWQSTFPDFNGPLPIVAIGHSKNFTSSAEWELKTFLKWAAAQNDLVFSTYGKWLKAADGL